MKEINHEKNLSKIFKEVSLQTFQFKAREGISTEFKESFNWINRDRYAKSMSAFANNKGGYLIFGVMDKPRTLVGISSKNFEDMDESIITSYLNSVFSPEIMYTKFTENINGKTVGIIYTYFSDQKPIVAIKNDGAIREAEIYHRYNARSEKIKYPELKNLFEATRESERKSWINLFEKVSKIGPSNTAIMDIVKGTIEGERNSLLIDNKLIPKLKFIKEGKFSENGKPTLKLIGNVKPIILNTYKTGKTAMRITNDPTALAVREETILTEYPLRHHDLVNILTKKYKDFKTNKHFYDLMRNLKKDTRFCHQRFLDPQNLNGTKKDYYSSKIIVELGKYYKKNK